MPKPTPHAPEHPAVRLVERLFTALGAGDLDTARDCYAEGALIELPGPVRFTSVEELTRASTARYRSIDKRREGYDVVEPSGPRGVETEADTVVFSTGTLLGSNLDDIAFSGVRYVDRFLVRAGRIVEHRIWNDLAHTGVLRQREDPAVRSDPDTASPRPQASNPTIKETR